MKAGLTNKQFQQQMFGSKSTDLYHLENAKNLRSDTLERMRDVLKCSMDDFFTIPEWKAIEIGSTVGLNSVTSNTAVGISTEVLYLKELLQEKDKRIETLENYIRLLEKQAD